MMTNGTYAGSNATGVGGRDDDYLSSDYLAAGYSASANEGAYGVVQAFDSGRKIGTRIQVDEMYTQAQPAPNQKRRWLRDQAEVQARPVQNAGAGNDQHLGSPPYLDVTATLYRHASSAPPARGQTQIADGNSNADPWF